MLLPLPSLRVRARNGSINPSTAQIVSYGSGTTFTITPATGYQISDVLVDGSSVGAVASYSFSGVTADHTISASFTIKTYTIATSVSSGSGIISPANPTLNHGASQTFTITPDIGYHIIGVLVDNVSVGPLTSYTFTNVTNNHTISASFAINTYTATPSVSGINGTISPTAPQTVNYNGTTTFTLSPSTGYHAVMSGTCGGTLSGDGLSYTTNAVTANCTVIASFSINTYTVTPSVSGVNGVISPTLPQTVSYNGTTTFTLSPDTGYHAVMSGTCGGTLSGNGLSYTTFGVTTDCTVIATFTLKATPSITWANPAAITYGTALGAAQLDATASLPGTFVYNPAAGVVLNAGANQTLSVTFTPTDTTNYSIATASVQITVNKATAPVTLGSLSQTYDGTQQPATATTTPAGLTVAFTYNLSATPPTNVGSYSVVGTINDTNYQGSASGTLVIAKAAGIVTLGSLSQTYDGTQQPATATTTPAGLTVTFTYNLSATPPTNAGSYSVVGTINDTNYQGSASGTLVIAKAAGIVTLGSLSQTYDGTQQPATATTTPAGLTVTFTYDLSATPPTNAGSYSVIGTINNTNYQGSASGTLVIAKAAGIVTLGSLSQTYDGTQQPATATTTPAGLTVTFTYDLSATPPTNAGSYSVIGTINNINYQGSASGTLVIAKAAGIVTLGSLNQTYDNTPKSATATTNPSGLTVYFTYDGSPTAPTAVGSYAVVGTINDTNYQGSATDTLVITP